jgi:PAS domain S-box-containing protein
MGRNMPREKPTGKSPGLSTPATDDPRLRLLIESVKDYAIFVLDPDGRIATWNPGAELIKGYKAEEIIGKHLSTFYPAEAREARWPEHELKMAAAEGRFEDEGWRLRKDGTMFWAHVVITALRDRTGELVGYAKVTSDLTDRKRHEEQLRRSEERFRLIVESVKDYAIYMLDPDGFVATWNAGAESIKGYRATEIIGSHFSKFYPDEAIERGWPEYELAVAREKGRFEDEGWRLRKDGSRFWANVVITALKDEHGRPRGFAKITRDLTERRRIEALEESNKRTNEFLAMLAHELRNPLAPIKNAVSVMNQPAATEAHVDWARGVIDRQITHLSRLVDDLLDVSRITTGKITLQREPVDLHDVVARAIEAAKPLIDARGHKLTVQLKESPIVVKGDDTRLTQVVLNLLNNAAKYTPDGGHITLAVARTEELATIVVSDTGIGMTPDVLPTVFDLFAQGHRALDRAAGGLGIGLTLVKRLVQMHGGEVLAKSAGPNQGSEFTVQLPLATTSARTARSSAEPPPKPSATRRLLVVDDNEDSAATMAMLLELAGHDVRTASDGQSALDAAREFRPDLILLDLGLPIMSGFEVAEAVRQLPGLEHVVMVAMTGYGQDDDKRRTTAAGFSHHLVKPVDPAALEKLVADLTPRS